jgi:hypothetical protein
MSSLQSLIIKNLVPEGIAYLTPTIRLMIARVPGDYMLMGLAKSGGQGICSPHFRIGIWGKLLKHVLDIFGELLDVLVCV